jgi:DNA polymerase-3 subunit delta'
MSQTNTDLPPDQIENCPHPRVTQTLLGHEAAETAFLTALQARKIHHAWLVEGPKGCGKATLAYRMARRVLGVRENAEFGLLGADLADPLNRQIEVGSLPDLLAITNGWNDRTKKWQGEISVDQVRKIGNLFTTRAAGNGWRVCIVDCADDLNRNAANALLKTLEEPPDQGLLILISHSPGRLLDTIRSRCRRLRLRAPGQEISTKVALQCGGTEAEAQKAAILANGCPGRAAQIANANGIELASDIDRIFSKLPGFDTAFAHKIANKLAARNKEQQRQLFLDLILDRMEARIRQLASEGHIQNLDISLKALAANQSLQMALNGINLDPAVTLIQILKNVHQAALASQNQGHLRNAG